LVKKTIDVSDEHTVSIYSEEKQ